MFNGIRERGSHCDEIFETFPSGTVHDHGVEHRTRVPRADQPAPHRSANDRSASRTAASTLSIRELTGSASLSDGLPATRESGQREAQRGLQRSGSWNFYFRVYPGAIRNPQVVEFLKHLMRHIPGRLLVVWDGLPSHRSRRVHDFVGETHGRPVLERLPSYAPEFNPVEYLWGYWKHHELRNFCPRDFGRRNDHAGGGLR